ncbi:MAG: metalloregulator ArsR/SmtB family transcription factor [bacterium]
MKKTIKILDALSEETRMRIFLLLINGNLCVCELVNILNMKQARISHIMKKLTGAGLAVGKRDGKWIIYSAKPDALKSGIVKGLLDDIKISMSDLKNLKQCKKGRIRENCGK